MAYNSLAVKRGCSNILAASSTASTRCDPLTFDLILIDGRGIVMDYPCVKFGDFSFSRSVLYHRTDRQNQTIFAVKEVIASGIVDRVCFFELRMT